MCNTSVKPLHLNIYTVSHVNATHAHTCYQKDNLAQTHIFNTAIHTEDSKNNLVYYNALIVNMYALINF